MMLTRETMERELKILTEQAGIPLAEAVEIISNAAAAAGGGHSRIPFPAEQRPGRRDGGVRLFHINRG